MFAASPRDPTGTAMLLTDPNCCLMQRQSLCSRCSYQAHMTISSWEIEKHLRHEAAGLCVQKLGLGAGVQQEGEGAE